MAYLANYMFLFVPLLIVSCYDCLQVDPLRVYHSFLGHKQLKSVKVRSRDNLFNSMVSMKTIRVSDFGAKANGADDTEAFEKAWEAACSSEVPSRLVVLPSESYRLKPVRLSGPCKSSITFQLYGTIEASDDRSDYKDDSGHWLVFEDVNNLSVEGNGIVDGNGKTWWQNSCKINPKLPCKNAPTALTFYKCKNVVVKNLKVQNAQQMHITFDSSKNVQVANLTVTSPGDSPNTDGIHVAATENIQITNSVIATGDDCISIVSGSQNVQAKGITCGPGHGISIGSLGSGNSKAYVSGVLVDGAKLSDTMNGVRIKTWQGGSGTASNIKFENIEMNSVTNPIIIDQNYCDQDEPCKEQDSAVQVKNVMYKNIKGTSASDVAVKFDCSKNFPCQGIFLENISLQRTGGDTAKAECTNVNSVDRGSISPTCSN